MSGGKGGSKTQKVEIPAWMEDVAKRNLARSEAMSKVGYQPYYGTDVVGFGPTGDMARQANIDAAIAFGMAPEGTKATPMGDMSSGTLYDQAVAEAARRNPGQEAYYNQFFVDPLTGAMPGYDQAIIDRATPGQPSNPRNPNTRLPGDPYDPGMNSPESGVVDRRSNYASNTPYGLTFDLAERSRNMGPLDFVASPVSGIVGSLADKNLARQGYSYVTNPNARGGGYYTRNDRTYGDSSELGSDATAGQSAAMSGWSE